VKSFSYFRALLFSFLCLTTLNVLSQSVDSYTSNEGRGLYFDAERMLPKSANLKFMSKKEVPKPLLYGDFYEDPFTNKVYLYTGSDVMAVEEFKSPGQLADKGQKVVEMVTISQGTVDEGGNYHNYGFVRTERNYEGTALRLPQHHLFPRRLQAVDPKRNIRLTKVLDQLNSLGLTPNRHVTTKSGGFNVIYDRLFINDEDADKFLVIWLKEDRLFANFLTNDGQWVLPEPKVIHKDITVYDDNGQALNRKFDGSTDKSTLVTELSCIKSGDGYYIGYSINSWESTTGFSWNISTCHVSLLSKTLEVLASQQIPNMVAKSDRTRPFASDLQMQLVKNNDMLYAVIQSPNVGRDKLFVQCFDKNLQPRTSLNYLSNNSQTYANLVPVVRLKDGVLITYKQKRGNRTDVFTQLIDDQGYAHLPVSIYEMPDGGNEYIASVHVSMDKNKVLHYYLKINDRKLGNSYLYQYQISLDDYTKALKYEIRPENWKEDKLVREANAISDAINKAIEKNGFPVFKKLYNESLLKTAYADSALIIRKFVTLNKQKEYSQENTYYYDQQGTVRKVVILLKIAPGSSLRTKPGIYTVYYNQDGKKLWEIKENEDGTFVFGEKDVDSKRLLYDIKINDPFSEFHKAGQY
jgi:hypothetical protein